MVFACAIYDAHNDNFLLGVINEVEKQIVVNHQFPIPLCAQVRILYLAAHARELFELAGRFFDFVQQPFRRRLVAQRFRDVAVNAVQILVCQRGVTDFTKSPAPITEITTTEQKIFLNVIFSPHRRSPIR